MTHQVEWSRVLSGRWRVGGGSGPSGRWFESRAFLIESSLKLRGLE